jgi:hypothetical protein
MSSTISAHVLYSVELLLDIAGLVERLGFQMVLKAGIGRFSPELRLIFRPAVTEVNQRGKERSNYESAGSI